MSARNIIGLVLLVLGVAANGMMTIAPGCFVLPAFFCTWIGFAMLMAPRRLVGVGGGFVLAIALAVAAVGIAEHLGHMPAD